MSRRRSPVRRRRNPGGAGWWVLGGVGGLAALVALSYQRKKAGAAQKTLEAAWAERDAVLEQANKGRLQEARAEQDALDAAQQAARDEAAARDAWRKDPRQELSPSFVDLSTKEGRRGECASVARNRWPSPFGRASAATCVASADPQVDAELRATGWKPGYAPPRGWVPPWGAQTEPVNKGVLAPDVKVLSGLSVLGPAFSLLDLFASGGAVYLSVLRHKKLRFWPVVGAFFFPWIALPYQGAMVAIKK